jgi:hypothetical protein
MKDDDEGRRIGLSDVMMWCWRREARFRRAPEFRDGSGDREGPVSSPKRNDDKIVPIFPLKICDKPAASVDSSSHFGKSRVDQQRIRVAEPGTMRY